jgi:hypothetical protein
MELNVTNENARYYRKNDANVYLVEVRFLRISASGTLNDDIGSIASGSDTLLYALLLHQL